QTTVTATTLERLMQQEKIGVIDLLWMDIQGAELLALKGLGSRIQDVKLMHLEMEFFPIYEGQPLFDDVHLFLREHGFELLGFTSLSRFFADAVYVPRTMLRGPLSYWKVAWQCPYLLRNRLKRLKHKLKGALLNR